MNELSKKWARYHRLYRVWIHQPEHYETMIAHHLPPWLRDNQMLCEKALLADARQVRRAIYKNHRILPGVL